MKFLYYKIIVIFFFLSIWSYALSDFLWPLEEKTHISGTFGEFRKNHIHAGVDISTYGKIGTPVRACESGNLYRVKTQYTGFGKTVYTKLPDGRFLVYAHLDRFSPKIEEIVAEAQLKNDNYIVDIYPESGIIIKKGESIGYTGDTGGVAPHLHLELRDKKERPLNILKNGFVISDKTPPKINGISVCDSLTSFVISSYPAKRDLTIYTGKDAGLAVAVSDESYGNKVGIYEIDLIINGELFFKVKFDEFSYDEFNSNFLVYNKDMHINQNRIYYNLFRAFNNNLPFYPLKGNGILKLPEGKHSVSIKAKDYCGNTATFNTAIVVKEMKERTKPKIQKGPWYSSDGRIRLEFEKLYSPVDIRIKTISTKATHPELIPVSDIYEISPKAAVFRKGSVYANPLGDAVGIYGFENGKWKYIRDNSFTTHARFCLFKDKTPPVIRIISNCRIHPHTKDFGVGVKIEDKGSGLNLDKLALYIDGIKTIAEYSVNKKELFYTGKLKPGKHKITCVAIDYMGNQTKKEENFTI